MLSLKTPKLYSAWLVANARVHGYDYLADDLERHLQQVASAATLNNAHVRDPFSRSYTRLGGIIAGAATWLRAHDVPNAKVLLIISR